jgi:hypothetical protein
VSKGGASGAREETNVATKFALSEEVNPNQDIQTAKIF